MRNVNVWEWKKKKTRWLYSFLLLFVPTESEGVTQWMLYFGVFSMRGFWSRKIEPQIIKSDSHLGAGDHVLLTNLSHLYGESAARSIFVSYSSREHGDFTLEAELQKEKTSDCSSHFVLLYKRGERLMDLCNGGERVSFHPSPTFTPCSFAVIINTFAM